MRVGDVVIVRTLEQVLSYLEVHWRERRDCWSHHIPGFRKPVHGVREARGGVCVQGTLGSETLCEVGAT